MGQNISQQILIIGPKFSGKTTLMNILQYNEPLMQSTPTHGIRQSRINFCNRIINIAEMTADFINQEILSQVIGFIAIVDSSDRYQQHQLMDIFQYIKTIQNKKFPTLLIANKQDKENAQDKSDIEAEVQISALTNKYFTIETTLINDIPEEELFTGLKWLFNQLNYNINIGYQTFKTIYFKKQIILQQQDQQDVNKPQIQQNQQVTIQTQSTPQWMN